MNLCTGNSFVNKDVKFFESAAGAGSRGAQPESGDSAHVSTAPPAETIQTSPVGRWQRPGVWERIRRFIVHLPTNIYYLILLIGHLLRLVSDHTLRNFERKNFHLLAFGIHKAPPTQELQPVVPNPVPESQATDEPKREEPPPPPKIIKPHEPPEDPTNPATAGIRLNLGSTRAEKGAIGALESLRTPEMLNQLKQLGVLDNDSAMAEVILTATGPTDEIIQNYGTDYKPFVLAMDAAISAVAHSRNAIIDPSKSSNTRLIDMQRNVFIESMAKVEEWYFSGKTGPFPAEFAGIRTGIEAWFGERAERNFDETEKKLGTDYKQHFRDLAPNRDMLEKIRRHFILALSYGVEDADLTLIEYQSREIRKEFTNLSLAVFEHFRLADPDGQQVADAYCSFERKLPEASPAFHAVGVSRLDAFWCQYPTEEFWGSLFPSQTGESPQQTADRVVEFFSTHPRSDSHSTNFLEYLVFAPCAERESAATGTDFTDDGHNMVSQRFWDKLRSVLAHASISASEQQALWQRLLEPLNNVEAWREAGPHTGNNTDAIATIGRLDYQAICEQMKVCGLGFDFAFDEDVPTRTRAVDLAFYSGFSNETAMQKIDYLTPYTRVQPSLAAQ
jgi:hypothetical protein